jgi:hypothetical protein
MHACQTYACISLIIGTRQTHRERSLERVIGIIRLVKQRAERSSFACFPAAMSGCSMVRFAGALLACAAQLAGLHRSALATRCTRRSRRCRQRGWRRCCWTFRLARPGGGHPKRRWRRCRTSGRRRASRRLVACSACTRRTCPRPRQCSGPAWRRNGRGRRLREDGWRSRRSGGSRRLGQRASAGRGCPSAAAARRVGSWR